MIASLIDTLVAANTGYRTVEHAWTLDAIDQLRDPMPYAIFVPGPINSDPSPSLPIRQRSSETVLVVTICLWGELEGLRNQLYQTLLGYQHAPEYTELEHRQGEVQRINGSIVHWVDIFATDRWMPPTAS